MRSEVSNAMRILDCEDGDVIGGGGGAEDAYPPARLTLCHGITCTVRFHPIALYRVHWPLYNVSSTACSQLWICVHTEGNCY
jgi:hypothetical protein